MRQRRAMFVSPVTGWPEQAPQGQRFETFPGTMRSQRREQTGVRAHYFSFRYRLDTPKFITASLAYSTTEALFKPAIPLVFPSALICILLTTCIAPAVRAIRVADPLCCITLVVPSQVTTPCST